MSHVKHVVVDGFMLMMAIVLVIASSSFAQTSPPKPSAKAPQEQAKPAQKSGNVITDSWITMKIHAQFIPEKVLDDSDINVDTKGGVVTLSGTVLTEAGRARAVAIAKATDGVKSVEDKLRIGPAAPSEAREAGREAGAAAREAAGTAKATAGKAGRAVTDGWIKSKIYSQYLTEKALDDSDINIDVTKGAVTLKGTVRSEAGRTRAVAIAKGTDGVKSVNDTLKVAPK